MNYYLYKITNMVKGHEREGWEYVGKRSTEKDIFLDTYMSSCKLLKEDIRNFGKENFKKEILVISDSWEYNTMLEVAYVDVEYVSRDNTYNQCIATQSSGRLGKDNHMTGRVGKKHHLYKRQRTEKERENISKGHARLKGKDNYWYGKNRNTPWCMKPVYVKGKQFNSVNEAAEYYSVRRHTITRWCREDTYDAYYLERGSNE